jgi:hypothetical protein
MSASSDSDNDGNDEDSIVFRLFGVVDLVEGFFGLRPVDPFTGPVVIRKQRSLAMRVRHGYNKHLNIYIYIYIHPLTAKENLPGAWELTFGLRDLLGTRVCSVPMEIKVRSGDR